MGCARTGASFLYTRLPTLVPSVCLWDCGLNASGAFGLMLPQPRRLFVGAQAFRGPVTTSVPTISIPGFIKCERREIPFLLAFSTTVGNRIEDMYYSMGTYRRGGRSSCTKRTNGTLKATPAEVYEHGRWTVKQSKENMPTRYNELTLADCINLTLLCM